MLEHINCRTNVVCVAMMRERLAGRAAKTLIGLGRQLANGSEKSGVTILQLQLALRQFHISITPEVSKYIICVQSELCMWKCFNTYITI